MIFSQTLICSKKRFSKWTHRSNLHGSEHSGMCFGKDRLIVPLIRLHKPKTLNLTLHNWPWLMFHVIEPEVWSWVSLCIISGPGKISSNSLWSALWGRLLCRILPSIKLILSLKFSNGTVLTKFSSAISLNQDSYLIFGISKEYWGNYYLYSYLGWMANLILISLVFWKF